MSEFFRINTANIMHETIDNEVVIVNMELGTYYSLDAVGADVWAQLAAGCTLAALVDGVASRFDGERDRIAAGVETFVRALQAETLILASPEPEERVPPPVAAASPAGAYADPVLQKYTDMEELLLVDPIHEVEDSGWPNVK